MNNNKVGIIGLGYVGLPLAVEFGKKYSTIGFDVNANRIDQLIDEIDITKEVSPSELKEAKQLKFSYLEDDLKDCNWYIITVPTPIDPHKRPDLTAIIKASETAGKALNPGDIIVYESTVYPGVTEEVCVPILEKASGLKYNQDFFCGYSPERINPGDKEHRLTQILKVTSGSTDKAAKKIDNLYKSIITAGTHLAPSIKIAEAAKVIENTQRDLNIALMNELSMLFNKMNINTHDVLKAAGTKWNFLPFRPGLVGGHCIGVDPYYLTYKAESVGYIPQIILAGRRLNDNMSLFVASEVIKLLIKNSHKVKGASILILGITFKENCPDIRNTKIVDMIKELENFGCQVDVYDPWADPKEVFEEYGVNLISQIDRKFDGIIKAVAHSDFATLNFDEIINGNTVLYDITNTITNSKVNGQL